jgi:hypothetical protein
VSAELELRLIAPEEAIVPLVASLFYTRQDPYAIRIAFHAVIDEHVEWTFARELLTKGIVEREGPGDVTFWPSAESDRPGAVLRRSSRRGESRR